MNLFWTRGLKTAEQADWFDRGYPIGEWQSQEKKYWDADYIFNGDWLNETVSPTDDTLKYPLQIDPFEIVVGMHVSFLFGEVPDGADSRVTFEVEVWRDGIKRNTAVAGKQSETMKTFLSTVWNQNHGHSLQSALAQNAQVYGGSVITAYYDPARILNGELPISLQSVDPPSFLPVWSARSVDELIEVIVAYGITKLQARDLGVDSEKDLCLYMEHWTRNEYEITVDDKPVTIYGNEAKGVPIGNLIPYVYIPHPPRKGFYGTSLLAGKLGQAREVNARSADVGDIISEDAANIPAIVNVRTAEIKRISGAKSVMDIGFQQGDRVPEVLWPPARTSTAANASQHVENMVEDLRMAMYCPPVLFGGGDSSQRSTSSFAFMAIPLIAHIRDERAAFTSGLARVNKQILTLAAELGLGGITREMARSARVKCNWYPMLPRDVMEEITSVISRVRTGILSKESAIEKIGDILDVKRELDRIDEEEPVTEGNPFTGATSGQLGGVQSAQKGDAQNV